MLRERSPGALEDRKLRALRVDLEEIDCAHIVCREDVVERVGTQSHLLDDFETLGFRKAAQKSVICFEQRGRTGTAREIQRDLARCAVERHVEVDAPTLLLAGKSRELFGIGLEADDAQVSCRLPPVRLQPAPRSDVDERQRVSGVFGFRDVAEVNVHHAPVATLKMRR